MEVCPVCKREFDGVFCSFCTVTDLKVGEMLASDKLDVESDGAGSPTAFLVDLVSNRKIPITTPRCKVGRDDLNDIVISGDQSISRFHFIITQEDGKYYVQDSKSRHGTYLNGNQISGPDPINDGDVLKVGVSLFWFVIDTPASSSSSEQFSPVDMETVPAEDAKLLAEKAKAGTTEIDLTSMPGVLEAVSKASISNKPSDATMDSIPISAEELKALAEAATPSAPPGGRAPEPKDEEDAGKSSGSGDKEESENEEPASSSDESNRDDEPNGDSKEQPDKISNAVLMDALKDVIDKSEPVFSEERDVKESDDEDEKPSQPEESRQEKEEEEKAERSESPSQDKSKDGIEMADADTITEDSAKPPKAESPLSAKFDKFASILGEASNVKGEKKESAGNLEVSGEKPSASDEAEKPEARHDHNDQSKSAEEPVGDEVTSNGAKSVMSIVKESTSTTVPEWCNRFFAGEINQLNRELTDLNEQVRVVQQKIRDVENRVAATKGLRNTLLSATGDDLVEACGKVLSLLGWRAKVADDDKQELRLDVEDKLSIARVVWTSGTPERTHLGQLSISQTRYWCEQGSEPKGILIISRTTGDQPPAPLTSSDFSSEFADYASKKNVCLMSTVQILAIYKEVAINDTSPDSIRSSILGTSGWLSGYNLEPADASETNKLSSLLSA